MYEQNSNLPPTLYIIFRTHNQDWDGSHSLSQFQLMSLFSD